jgi:hypothetical protein
MNVLPISLAWVGKQERAVDQKIYGTCHGCLILNNSHKGWMRKINKLSFPWNQTPNPLEYEDCPYHWITIIDTKDNLQLNSETFKLGL